MSKKRVHYPVHKDKIAESIKLYTKYVEHMEHRDLSKLLWDAWYDKIPEISSFSYCKVAIPSLFQAMEFAGTLTVDNVYYAIIAAGINTTLEDYDE